MQKHWRKWIGIAGAVLFTTTLQAAPAPAPSDGAPKGDAASGKKLYTMHGCWQCHGTVGQGARVGATLTPAPPFAVFMTELRSPAREMPPYMPKLLPDQDAADIYAYVKTFPASPDYKTIKLLNSD